MKIPLLQPDTVRAETMDQHYEQTDYLEGVLWSDPARRLNPDVDVRDIDQHGTGQAAFWRGMLEAGAGSVAFQRTPRVRLRARYPVLAMFLAFVHEVIHRNNGIEWDWDTDGKLAFQAAGGEIVAHGVQAQDVVRALYPPDSQVGMESVRDIVDTIVAWAPRG